MRGVPAADPDAELITEHLSQMDPVERVRWQCMNGQCGVFAAILEALTGWPALSVEAHRGDEWYGIHAGCEHPDGGFVDADGWSRDADSFAVLFVTMSPHYGPSWGGRIARLADTTYGYAYGWPGVPEASISEVFGHVMRVLGDIGYEIPPERRHVTRDELALALAVGVAECPYLVAT